MLAAFGDPGHAFPAIALGRALVERGHEVCLQTWERWQEPVRGEAAAGQVETVSVTVSFTRLEDFKTGKLNG